MRQGKSLNVFVFAVLALGLLILAACTATVPAAQPAGESAAPAPAAAADHANDEYIYVSAMGNLEFFNAHKYGWKWAGDELGVKTSYVGPAEYDMNAMAAAFDQAIARQPKGIAVFAVEPILKPQIDKAVEAGIPVVTILGDIPDSKRMAFVGSRQYDLGYLGGMKLAEALGGKGKVAILSIPSVAMFDEREQGYRAAFANYPEIEVVQVGDTKADAVTAVSTAKDILQRHPNLAAFAGTDSTGGMGAATAVKEAELAGKVKIVAMDRNSDVLQMIKDGIITGAVAQNDAAMAYWALLTLTNANYAQPPLTSDNVAAGAQAGPNNVFMAANYVDASNLDLYLKANELYKP
jgi:ribose transport system substrate-binding protein